MNREVFADLVVHLSLLSNVCLVPWGSGPLWGCRAVPGPSTRCQRRLIPSGSRRPSGRRASAERHLLSPQEEKRESLYNRDSSGGILSVPSPGFLPHPLHIEFLEEDALNLSVNRVEVPGAGSKVGRKDSLQAGARRVALCVRGVTGGLLLRQSALTPTA